MAEPLTARYVLYVSKRENANTLLQSASSELKRQIWIQELGSIQPAGWMQGISAPILVDRRNGKAYAGGAEKEILDSSAAKPAFGKVDNLED